MMKTLKLLFNRQWWWVTLVVIAGCFALVRLGLWQLDRLEQRRAFNAYVAERWKQDPFPLSAETLPASLDELEYRRVEVEGTYDYDNQILLTNQPRGNTSGVVLVTPLIMDGGEAVLVARGWIPYTESQAEAISQFDEAATGPIVGLVQESQLYPGGQPVPVPDTPQQEWYYLNIDAIQPQMPYTLLPVFVLQLPEDGRSVATLPFRQEPLRLDEGNHFSYAIQWMMFAVILGFGYIQYVRFFDRRSRTIADLNASEAVNQPVGVPDDMHVTDVNSAADSASDMPKVSKTDLAESGTPR
ncbi:MAG: SURF1 family protein [Sphingomonadaceae bacterium]